MYSQSLHSLTPPTSTKMQDITISLTAPLVDVRVKEAKKGKFQIQIAFVES